MNITAFDPLENGLMFERFLSPQRTEMPDIDMDFDDERRLEVVEHVRQLYGPEKVTHVITYSTIKAKQAINDAARVLDYPVYMGQRLSKMVSSDPKVKLKQVLEKQPGKEDLFNPDFAEAYKKDDDARRIIDTALSIEGLTRGEGVHACAVLICRDPVNEHVPTKLDTKGGVEITQYEGHTVADMGLLKMDFLGLRTLTVISKAKANIKKNFGIDIKEEEIPFDDPEIFKLMGSGHTAGVFQVESAGMTATIKNMKPTEYKHVVALIALYRPGPLGAGMVSSYINRMNGKEPAVSYDDRLDDILGETYGTMVYQEQVMLISVEMCGFSKGESDSRIRKPVAKKKIKLLTSTVLHWEDGSDETTYDHWMNGAIKNNYTREVAKRFGTMFSSSRPTPSTSRTPPLRHPGYADGVAQGALSARVHGGRSDVLYGQDRQDRALRLGMPSRRHPRAVARCQRVRYRVHGYQGGRALWSGRHPRRGHRRGAGDYRRARGGRPV